MSKNIKIISFLTLVILALGIAIFFVWHSFFTDNKEQPQITENRTNEMIEDVPSYEKPQPQVSLLAVGDIMLSRSVDQLMVKENDFTLPFQKIANLTSDADISFANLETSIIDGRPVITGEFSFRANEQSPAGLKLGGFDVVSLANNHTPNFGQRGLLKTFEKLDEAGIKYIGAAKSQSEVEPVIIGNQGIKLGFLAYTDTDVIPEGYHISADNAGVVVMDEQKLKSDIAKLKQEVDFVIVSMHSGTEYTPTPNPRQTEFAHAAIDTGAALVIGHHPHVVQTIEKYKDGYIFYSLGNFIFDQKWSTETQQGMMAKVIFSPTQIQSIQFTPVRINEDYQPQEAVGQEAEDIIKRLDYDFTIEPKFSYDNGNLVEQKNWWIFSVNSVNSVNSASQLQELDLDNDGKLEQGLISSNTAYIIKDNKVIWQSDKDWQIENIEAGDFNNDGKNEFGFSLWKQGSYGPNLPFWQKENDKNLSNHLFLYQLNDGDIHESPVRMIWGSSALDQPIKEMKLADLNHDGKNELIVIEDTAAATSTSQLPDIAVWQWNGFNFSKQAQSENGLYFDLKTDLNYIYIRKNFNY